MLEESLNGLNIKPDGTYVDLTFGGGGHSNSILSNLSEKGSLYSFDVDADALINVDIIKNNSFNFIEGNFRFFGNFLKLKGKKKVDGIIADLGISSHQIDTEERGFSIRGINNLDMRMNAALQISASDLLNTYKLEKLIRIFSEYGEIRNSIQLANFIVKKRSLKKIKTNLDLIDIIKPFAIKNRENKYYAKVFQALRIEVNDEINALKDFLIQTPQTLNDKGRLVIISYHSLEDRLVKNFINKGNFIGESKKDLYGNEKLFFKPINKKPITPKFTEIKNNPRARSAKMRIGKLI